MEERLDEIVQLLNENRGELTDEQKTVYQILTTLQSQYFERKGYLHRVEPDETFEKRLQTALTVLSQDSRGKVTENCQAKIEGLLEEFE